MLDGLKKAIANSLTKLNKTRDPASQNSLNYVRKNIFGDNRPTIAIHPALLAKVDQKEEALNQFKSLISSFKPKQSVLEIGISKSMDHERITAFKETIAEQVGAKRNKAQRMEQANEMRTLMETAQQEEDQRMINMQTLVKQNDLKLSQPK